jgi:Hydantoinase/oxoprolinase N-terminal region/Hydantoinase B/oxoprolinase
VAATEQARTAATAWLVGVDGGGTFTDAVAIADDGSVRVAKVSSTPDDPSVGFERALTELAAAGVPPGSVRLLGHGEYLVLGGPQTATLYAEQTDARFRASGARGGCGGAPSKITVITPDGAVLPPASKFTRRLQPGSVVRVETAGGGGYGDPRARDPARRAADTADGLVPAQENP